MPDHREGITPRLGTTHQCAGCGSTYPSPLAAALCCDVEYDQPAIVRSHD